MRADIDTPRRPSAGNTPDRLLPLLLRGTGAAALAAAVVGLLLREWSEASDLYRYLLLLSLTLGMAVLGLLSGRFIGESKGARLLVTAALAALPANFAVLGALWLTSPGGMLMAIGAVAVLLLAAVALTGFLVLSRVTAARFAALYLLGSAVLLLPARELDLLALPTAGLALLTLVVATSARLHLPDTQSSWTARALLFLPLAVLLGRSFWFYSMEPLYQLISLLIGFAVLRFASLALGAGPIRQLLEFLAVPMAIAAGITFASWLTSLAPMPLLSSWVAPTSALLTALLMHELSGRACSGRRGYRIGAATLLGLAMLLNLLALPNSGGALACLLIGLGLMVCAYLLRQRVMLGTGALLLLAGLLHEALRLAGLFDWGNWGTLALLGVTAILLSSALERYGPRLRIRLHHWRNELGDWES